MPAGAERKLQRVLISWIGANGQTFFLTLDATTDETHVIASEVTEHPVEEGVNMSDHVRAMPDRLSLQAVISNTPIFLPPDFSEGAQAETIQVPVSDRTLNEVVEQNSSGQVGASLGFIPGATGVAAPLFANNVGKLIRIPTKQGAVQGWTPDFDRVKAAYGALRRLREAGQLVFIDTTLGVYSDMALESIEITRNAGTGSSLPLSISARQVRIGATKVVTVPALSTKKKDTGKKATKPAENTEPEEARSVLFNLFGD